MPADPLESPGPGQISPLKPFDIHRIEFRHGAAAPPILERMKSDPAKRQVVCICQHVVRAEIDHCVAEGATTLEQVSERTGLGVGACGGVRCTFSCAQAIVDATSDPTTETNSSTTDAELIHDSRLARELVRRFHSSPRTLAHALKVDGDLAAKGLLEQIERLRAFKAAQKK